MNRGSDALPGADKHLQLSLLGRFSLRALRTPAAPDLPVTAGGQRLLALLAFRQRPVGRAWLAASLWAGSDERHASWSLRSTLHRLPQSEGRSPVLTVRDTVLLSTSVRVDTVDLVRAPLSLGRDDLAASRGPEWSDIETLDRIAELEHDVLPDWHDEWVIVERERHRQLRLHALETLSRRLTEARRFGLAVHAGLAAVYAEPLRESAHRAVIEAHLGEGNLGEAVRQYQVLGRHLFDELAVSPSRSLQDLVFGSRHRLPNDHRGAVGR